MRYIGVCLGASTVKVVELSREDGRAKVVSSLVKAHEGNPRRVLGDVLRQMEVGQGDAVVATGRKFRHYVNLPTITEPEAVERAFRFVTSSGDRYDAIVSAGGETFMVYALDEEGKIMNVHTGNKCASGTGEFFLQQIRRMNLCVEEAVRLGVTATPRKVTGRCSVFCKSDCTHALNVGEPKGNVTAGLCQMMAQKVLELLAHVNHDRVLLVGGVAQNPVLTHFLRQEIPHVEVPACAAYFEAVGAGLCAMERGQATFPGHDHLFAGKGSSFTFLHPLREFEDRVTFKHMDRGEARDGDRCIIGLDVGSTTTKAIVMREADDAILGSIYLRTGGNPVAASRECYADLARQIPGKIEIVGLGVTGSGRQIAGLHALTEGIINEIIAHATAAVYFDPDVDTIFEIGGQDAKYTYLVNGVPCDYAMNEACSAGTGSFLEESAKETLGIEMEEIAEIAMRGENPPNFNDQCAAFINSDIKTAAQEGIKHEDIVAGLVYSICMNYNNRVRGSRPVGKKLFMQGGVCYNRAVPMAMAALTDREVIVPPEPGLMGAFGVALEVKRRMRLGLLTEQRFDLAELAARSVEYGRIFECRGGKEECDRRCRIITVKIEGQTYPFGGACNRYYNTRHHLQIDAAELDLVGKRQRLVFEKYAANRGVSDSASFRNRESPIRRGRMGITKSFLTNTFFPLYSHFFSELGMEVVLAENVSPEGIDRKGSAFCYPADIAHGLFQDLLEKGVDYVFLPHVLGLEVPNAEGHRTNCVFVQAEPYYLRTAFGKVRGNAAILSPIVSFENGLEGAEADFVRVGRRLGFSAQESRRAYGIASEEQRAFWEEGKRLAEETLRDLEKDASEFAVVLFGRPYNAFAGEANMGIPRKFASRGVRVIPFDLLPCEGEQCDPEMFWAGGKMILKAARLVKNHPQLFAAFISNFSCGPDSFIITYFRDIMGIKPSVVLELDDHTADAGLDTRVDAFLDVVRRFRELEKEGEVVEKTEPFHPAVVTSNGKNGFTVRTNGGKYPLQHPSVRLLFPSMGDLGTEAMAAVMNYLDIRAVALPEPDEADLKIGRANTNCKECLPLQLTTGSLLRYVEEVKKPEEVVVYFMPTSSGPCRFGQYSVFLRNMIRKERIEDVAVLSLTNEDSYSGFGHRFTRLAWKAIVISDVMDDIRSALKALAVDREEALGEFRGVYDNVLTALRAGESKGINRALQRAAARLSQLPLKCSLEEAMQVAVIGEIYVRRDRLSRRGLTDWLAERGFVVRVAPINEWLWYVDHLIKRKMWGQWLTRAERMKLAIRRWFQDRYEREIKRTLATSSLYHFEMTEVARTFAFARRLIHPRLRGEAILTVGLALREILDTACGVISIGPFGCMPSRVAEAILSETMTLEGKHLHTPDGHNTIKIDGKGPLPFLSIETDGNPYPQLIEARLEAFCLQAARAHEQMRGAIRRGHVG
jgi:predicted CoA-substrate-specific enzyme activase